MSLLCGACAFCECSKKQNQPAPHEPILNSIVAPLLALEVAEERCIYFRINSLSHVGELTNSLVPRRYRVRTLSKCRYA